MHLMSGVKVSGQFTNFMISTVSSSGILRSRELNRGSEQQKQTQTQSSALGDSKLPTPYTFLFPLLSENVLWRFSKMSQLGHLSEAEALGKYGAFLQSSWHKDGEKRYSLDRKGALEKQILYVAPK